MLRLFDEQGLFPQWINRYAIALYSFIVFEITMITFALLIAMKLIYSFIRDAQMDKNYRFNYKMVILHLVMSIC